MYGKEGDLKKMSTVSMAAHLTLCHSSHVPGKKSGVHGWAVDVTMKHGDKFSRSDALQNVTSKLPAL